MGQAKPKNMYLPSFRLKEANRNILGSPNALYHVYSASEIESVELT